MAEETIPNENIISGGVLNPLAKEQVRLEIPEVAPAPRLPGSQIPTSTGNYSGKITSPIDYVRALKGHMENPESYASDQYKYGKNYAYDADYTGANFQRYYNSPKVFKQAGFSPWRNNEKIYNQQMNWWDSFKRSGAQAGHLFSTGFSAMLPWNAWDGSSTDEKSAVEMERAHMIGADNRGGFGSFFNNLTLDSGYTFGIGAEFAAEEIGIWGTGALLSPITGGTSLAASATESAIQSARAISLLDKLKNLGTLGKTISKSWEGFKSLKDINKVRDIYTNIKSGKPLEKILSILTPGTAEWAKDTYRLSKNGENVATLANASRGVGAFYRDAREIAAALSESKLEGGSEELRLRNQLTDSFYKDNGRMPNSTEYEQIFQYAQDAGRETYLWNLPALWISNKLVFDKAFKGIRPLQAFRKELSEGLAGKLAFDEAAAKAGKEAWSVTKTGMMDSAKSLFKASTYAPKNLLRNLAGSLLTYGKANLTEGLQEQYQDAISNAMNDYYTARYNHPGQTASQSVWGAFGNRVKEQFTTKQGWETFASGFLMGSLVQFPQHIIYEKIPEKFYQYSDPQGFNEFKEKRQQRTEAVVNALNEVTKDPKKFFNSTTNNSVSQAIANDHSIEKSEDGDIKGYLDINDEAVFEHLHTLLKTGKLNLITDYLSDMKTLSGSELEEAYGKVDPNDGDPKEFYTKKLDSMLNRAQDIKKRYEYVDEQYGNPFNPSKYSPSKDTSKYNDEIYKWEAWEEAKKMAVFSSHSFDRTLSRMNDVLQDITSNKPLSKAQSSDFSLLFDQNQISLEIKFLRDEVNTLNSIPGSKREATKKSSKLEALRSYRDTIDEYQTALKSKEDRDLKVTESLKALHKSYKEYLKVIADQYNDHVFDNKIDSSFSNIKDFYHLEHDSKNMADVINMLHNPEAFSEYARRAEIIKRNLHENRLNLFRKSFENKLDADDMNDLLNQIYELGAFFYPNEIDSFKRGQMPSSFYDVTTGDKISESSDKYKQITTLIEKFEQTHNIGFEGKEITGRSDESDNIDTKPRNKIADDKRSYRDLANQFGFDVDASETSVATSKVLDTIIASPYATYREKALARRLRTITTPEQTIRFRNNSGTPGTYDDVNGVIIDPRYSSRDFKGGTLPIEHVILHEQLHYITSDGLKTDSKFSDDINKLLSLANEYFSRPDTRAKFGEVPYYGLKNADEFIAESMTNDRFQLFLQEIPYEQTGTSTWEEFINSIKRFLSRILGISSNNTVLGEALHLITSKIDSEQISQEEVIGGEAKISDKTVITNSTPINSMPEDLINKLLEAYKALNRERFERNEELLDAMIFEKTDGQLINSDQFKSFVKFPGKPATIIRNYNQSTNRITTENTVDQPVVDEDIKNVKIVGWKMKQDLMKLGYDRSEVNKMSYPQAKRIVDSNIVKGSEEKQRQVQEEAEKKERTAKQINAMNTVRKELDKIQFVSDLDSFYNTLRDAIKDTNFIEQTGLNSDILTEMVDEKRKQLSNKVTFEELVPNEVVMMKDSRYGRMVVVEKTKDEVKFRKYGEPSAPLITIKKANVESNIIYKDRPDMENDQINIPIDKATSNRSIVVSKKLNDTDTIKEDITVAKSKTDEDLDKELLNNLGC